MYNIYRNIYITYYKIYNLPITRFPKIDYLSDRI